MKFFKYHALGNDYLVIDPKDLPAPLTEAQIKVICHRNFGVGSDGILLGPLPSDRAEFAKRYGPLLENHPHFPKRTNVQFLKVLDRRNIQIEIWERGAGYTLASGSSSSAAAAVARKLGLCELSINVHMPGGKLAIEISDDFYILMTGPVTKVAEGMIAEEMFGVA